MCIADRPPSAMLCSSISSDVAWAATMPWREASLMEMTFCMTGSPCRFGGAFVGQIDSRRTFRDVCTEWEKWFHARENCFVAALATKQSGLEKAVIAMSVKGRRAVERPLLTSPRLRGEVGFAR